MQKISRDFFDKKLSLLNELQTNYQKILESPSLSVDLIKKSEKTIKVLLILEKLFCKKKFDLTPEEESYLRHKVNDCIFLNKSIIKNNEEQKFLLIDEWNKNKKHLISLQRLKSTNSIQNLGQRVDQTT